MPSALTSLVFESLAIQDFKAFRGTHKVPLNLPGVTYLLGENLVTDRLSGNGAAKSTIWDALVWCLYGRTPLGLRNNDVKPWAGGKTSVGLSVMVGTRRHLIQRSTSPNRFTCDGEDIPDISAVLDIGFELLINTIILPQDKPLFFDRSPRDKMLLFSEAMPLERWDTRSKAASNKVSELETEVSALERDLSSVQGALEEVDASVASTKIATSAWADQARKQSRNTQDELSILRKQRQGLDTRLGTAILAQDGALTELRACDVQLKILRAEDAALASKIGSHDAQIKVVSNRLASLDVELEELSEKKTCPVCQQSIQPRDLKQHLGELEKKIEAMDAELTNFKRACSKLVLEKQAKAKMLNTVMQQADGFADKAQDATDTVLRYRPGLADLDVKIAALSKAPEEVNPYTKQLATLETRRTALVREEREITADLDRQRANIEHNKFWVKGFKDIKLQLIEDVLGELEWTANSMIEEVGLEGWEVKFDIEREAKSGSVASMINVEIISPESREKAVKWESFSGGERQRLRLVGSLACADVLLAHAGIETNLEVLDEPAVYWAGEGVQELVTFLATRAREQKKSIFFIEHSAVESVHFSRVWTVTKDKSGARIRQ